MGKYKVGDKVRVKSREWWEKNKDENDKITTKTNPINKEMAKYCGMEATITAAKVGYICIDYHIDIDIFGWYWPEEAFEDVPTTEQSTIYTDLANAINKVVSEHNQSVMVEEIEGGIIIKPIEKKEEDLPIDTPVMCSNLIQGEYAWYVRYYAGDGKTWWDLGKSCNEKRKVDWKCIIPFDKFDPTNIEESLKHNIVKLYGQR